MMLCLDSVIVDGTESRGLASFGGLVEARTGT